MKFDLNEAETRAELIDPMLAGAGWGKVDIVDVASASNYFREIMQREYEVIYSPEKSVQ